MVTESPQSAGCTIARFTGPAILEFLRREVYRVGLNEVARRVRMPASSLSEWIRREPCRIPLDTFFRVAQVLNATVEVLAVPPSPLALRRPVRYRHKNRLKELPGELTATRTTAPSV